MTDAGHLDGAGRLGDRTSRVASLFDFLSPVYDTAPVQALVYRPPQNEIVAALRDRRPQRIADVGCGTGILASRLSEELNPQLVYGCDASEGMLSQARQRDSRVVWIRSLSEALPIPDDSLDAVVSSHAFHFFDQPAALSEFNRVLVPGGAIAIAVLNPLTVVGSRFISATTRGAGWFPSEWAMRRLVADAGFTKITQTRVRRGPTKLASPDVVTIAEKPEKP